MLQRTAKKETRVAYRHITRLIRSIPKASKLKKKLGVNRKPVKSAWWNNEMRKKRKDRIQDDIKTEISDFYLSPEVSPCKERVCDSCGQEHRSEN